MSSSKTAVTQRLRKRFAIGVVRWNRIEQARRLAESSFGASASGLLKGRFKTRYS